VHPLIPEFILKNYSSGITSGSFSAAGLFVDVSGFSKMTDLLMEHGQHGAEIMAEVMRSIFAPLMASIYEQGGFIISQSGDAFNAIIPLEPDHHLAYLRTLSAAVNIQTRAAQNKQFDTPYGRFSINVKVGVGLGNVSWGIITSLDEQRAAYYFQGSAVDASAEAEHHANPEDVMLDTTFYDQVKDVVRAEVVEDHYRLLEMLHDPEPACSYSLPDFDLNFAARFYPHELYLQPHSGEFRRCTYLFVRLPTIRTEAQLAIFMQTIFELQDQYGGLLELRFGDKGAHLLLIWGAPTAYENDVERSLNFIFELQARTTIPINAGVTYRMAHVGFIGCELAEEYTGFGRGVNLAARFMTAAPRGEIWVDEYVFQRASRLFEFDYGGEKTFKGFSQSQKYYILLERKERIEYEYKGELVGRQSEMHSLFEFVRPIFSGQYSGMLIVSGEAGIGKSRLLHEFVSDLASSKADEFQVFVAQTEEMIRQSFNPLRYWLRQYFEVSDTQSEIRNKRSFNRKIDELIDVTADSHLRDELDRTRSFLGALVGLFWSDSLYEQLEARDRYENTIIAMNVLLQSTCKQKPTILLLEDIHWLDPDTQAYLPVLLRSMSSDSTRQYPFAVLATARLEEMPSSLEELPHREIRLNQLGRSALAALAATELKSAPGESLLDLLAERSQGNPFFAEELLRYLDQNNLLNCQADGCVVLSDQEVTLPVNISALLIARLDALMQDVKDMVQTAAVIGREFDINLLTHMLSHPPRLMEKMQSAQQASILTALSEIRYIFRHTLMRDTAYNMLIMSRRKYLHQLVVTALETVYDDYVNNHYGELAYHSFHADAFDKARQYYRLAAEAAQKAFQNALAVDYITQAISLTHVEALTDRFDLLLTRLEVYDSMGRTADRHKDLAELKMLAADINDPEKNLIILLQQSNLELDMDAYEAAYDTAMQALAIALDVGNVKQAAHGYRYAGTALYRMGKYQPAVDQIQLALDCAHQINDPELLASIQSNLGLIYLDQEKIEPALEYFSQALDTAVASNHLSAQVKYLNNLAQTIGFKGNFINARAYFERALEIIHKIGLLRDQGLILGNLGWVAANLGDFDAAYRYQLENLHITRQMGHHYPEGIAMINLSAASSALGNYAEAVQWGEQALTLMHKINHLNGEAWAQTYLGHALFAQNRLEEATTAYRAAIAIRSQLNQNILAAEPIAGLAQVSFQLGNTDAACEQLEPVLAMLDSGSLFEGTDEPLRIFYTCYVVLNSDDDDRANGVLEKGYSVLQARAVQILNEVTRHQFLDRIPHHRIICEAWENKNRLQ
jgi:predicted ATPase/class 3 adenylate cyclase